jgi:hypothetical protein
MRNLALGAAMAGSIAGAAYAEPRSYNGYEIPQYEVIQAAGPIELRRYAPHIVAEVQMPGGKRRAASQGFRAVANYIFGGNASGQKVAMTAPVTQRPAPDGWTIRFMMPSRYTLKTLPVPNNASVKLHEVDPGLRLVMRFSGRAIGSTLEGRLAQLKGYAATQGLTLTGGPEYAYYDDPFTLPWRRRNEVSYRVD